MLRLRKLKKGMFGNKNPEVDNFFCNSIRKNWFTMVVSISLNWHLILSLTMKIGPFYMLKYTVTAIFRRL